MRALRHSSARSPGAVAELPPRITSGRAASTASSETPGVKTGASANTLRPPQSAITSLMM
jgi:hypothetical protein